MLDRDRVDDTFSDGVVLIRIGRTWDAEEDAGIARIFPFSSNLSYTIDLIVDLAHARLSGSRQSWSRLPYLVALNTQLIRRNAGDARCSNTGICPSCFYKKPGCEYA
jgi:hypothetical protein